MEFPRKERYRSGEVLIFNDTIAYIVTAIRVGDPDGWQLVAKTRAMNDTYKLVCRPITDKGLQESDTQQGTASLVQVLSELMHQNISKLWYLIPGFVANFAELNDICRRRLDQKYLNLRDGRERCTVSAPVAAWPCAKADDHRME